MLEIGHVFNLYLDAGFLIWKSFRAQALMDFGFWILMVITSKASYFSFIFVGRFQSLEEKEKLSAELHHTASPINSISTLASALRTYALQWVESIVLLFRKKNLASIIKYRIHCSASRHSHMLKIPYLCQVTE